MNMLKSLSIAVLMVCGAVGASFAQSGPLRIEITDGVIEPLPFAVPDFVAENGEAGEYAAKISRVIASDLAGTGLFREISADAFISNVSSFDAPVAFQSG